MAAVIPLVVIVGPTASGKTALALDIAERYNGEIIAADSRTVYRGLDIGTAKPSREEQVRVPHHLIDVVDADETFTLGQFQLLATQAIADIRSRGKLPLLVGGTGLYIDSIIFDYQLGPPADPEIRRELEGYSVDALQVMIEKQHLELPINNHNKRHLTRVLEQGKINTARRNKPIDHCIIAGIATEKQVLEERIMHRAKAMFAAGVIDEAARAGEQYGWATEALSGNIYRLAHRVMQGEMITEEAIEKFIILDRRLAKRQRTWFRRNPHIVWGSSAQTKDYIEDQLHRAGITSVLR